MVDLSFSNRFLNINDMKKIFFLFLSSIILLSCGSSKVKSIDNTEVSESELQNTVNLDSLYSVAITFVPGEVTRKDVPGVYLLQCTMPLTIQNNTAISFSPEDYEISYEYIVEDTVDGELVDTAKKGSLKGPELPANSSVETSIVEGGLGLENPSVKLTINKEEFEKRYKENQH